MIYVPFYFEDPQHADHCVRWMATRRYNLIWAEWFKEYDSGV